jgi:hypothetical protein
MTYKIQSGHCIYTYIAKLTLKMKHVDLHTHLSMVPWKKIINVNKNIDIFFSGEKCHNLVLN